MTTDEGAVARDAEAGGRPADRDRALADRFRRLPPAVPIATTVAVVGGLPAVPLGPDGAGGGGDGE